MSGQQLGAEIAAAGDPNDRGRLKFILTLFGQQAVIEGPVDAVRPHVDAFFAIADALLRHNIDIGRRQIDAQLQHVMAQVMSGAGGGH